MFTTKPNNYNDWVESLRNNRVRDRFSLFKFTKVTASLILALLVVGLWSRAETTPDTGSALEIAVTVTETTGQAGDTPTTDAVLEKAYGFVVSIYVEGGEVDTGSAYQASGSGVIVSTDGYIVTNRHVVERATAIYVRFNGDTESVIADLIGLSPDSDLAVLKVERTDLVSGVFAKNDTVSVGDSVVAVGYAVALDGPPSVSKGIVSGVDRTLSDGDDILSEMVQTDAALSSGNSGGPLLNDKGDIVGINTLVLNSGMAEYVSNIGFAISSDKVVSSIQALTRGAAENIDKPKPGVLGVSVQERPQGADGVIVERIEPGSGASLGGMLVGDIIVSVNKNPVYSTVGIRGIVKNLREGDRAIVEILRKDVPIVLEIVVGAKTEE